MSEIINNYLNGIGRGFCDYAADMFIQSSVLIILLLIIDFLLRKRVRATFRYWIWMLVFVKLILPPSLSLPTGIGYWYGDALQVNVSESKDLPDIAQTEPAASVIPERTSNLPPESEAVTQPSEILPVQPAQIRSQAAAPIEQADPELIPLTRQGVLFGLWLTGVVVITILLLQRIMFVKGLVAQSEPAGDNLVEMLNQCRKKIGIKRKIELRLLNNIQSPAVCGLFRPVILIPKALLEKLSHEKLKTVLIHELAHLKRGDLWINCAQTLLQIIYFYNPLIWLVNVIVRRVREQAVDEMVLVTLGPQAKTYSNTLIDIAEIAFFKTSLSLRLIGVVESKKALQGRIKHMLSRPIPESAKIGVFSTTLIVIIAAILLPMAKAQKPEPGGKPAPQIENKTGLAMNKDVSVAQQVNSAGAIPKTALAGESDTVVDPNTGLEYTVVKTIAGTNDVIEHQNRITMSPNGKFLLWSGHVVPLDGSPVFTLKELKGARIAAWSPDGRKIAFNSDGIEVLPVSPETGRPTGAVRKLLEDNEDWFRGRIYWSADSERILFVKRNSRMEREAGSITLRDGRLDKHPDYADFGLVSADGKTIAYSVPDDGVWAKPVSGGPSMIARPRSSGLSDNVVVWTLDSQWVASAIDEWWREEVHFARPSDGQNFDVFPPEATGTFVGKSADGKKLCFYRSSFDSRTTSKVVPVSGGPALDMGPFLGLDDLEDHIWSSDSASGAVLGMDKEGHQQLWFIALSGGDRVRFNLESLGKDGVWLWSLSPDGSKALYSVERGANQETKRDDLYVVPISLKEGRAVGPPTLVFEGWRKPSPSLPQRRHAWSPAGTRIVMPHRSDQGNGHWVLFADGSKPIQITETPNETESYPQWSPDGRMVALYRCASDREMLQVIPAAGGTAKTILTTPKGQFPSLGWSSEGKEVMVACNNTISGFPITGGSARVIVRLQDAGYESASWFGWSPNGQRLAFCGEKRGEPSRLCLFSPDTGKIAALENSPNGAWDFAWSPDGKMISCTVEEAEKTRPAGVLRELDIAKAVQKAPPVTESKPTEATTGAPQAEPIAGPVFTDDFDNGPSRHWRFQDMPDVGLGPGRHAIENGELMLSYAMAYLDGIDWADYIVTVRVCMKEVVASGEGVFGITARTTPSNFGIKNRDLYQLFIVCNDNSFRNLWLGIGYRDASNTLHHSMLSQSPCSLVRDKWYTLEFEVRGQHLRGYLDGKLVIESTDGRLLKGGVRLNAWRARALFDDFSVRQLLSTGSP